MNDKKDETFRTGDGDWLHARGMRHGVILRTLAEIHLLVDNITVSLNKGLPAIAGLDPREPTRQVSSNEWLTQLGEIEWPPSAHTSIAAEAKASAFLTEVRNALNQRASPASGPSIGFTLLVAGDQAGGSQGSGRNKPDGDPSRLIVKRNNADDLGKNELAEVAFPHLIGQVGLARRLLFFWIPVIMGIALAITAVLSYDANQGTTLATHLNTAYAATDALADQIAAAEDNGGLPLTGTAAAGSTTDNGRPDQGKRGRAAPAPRVTAVTPPAPAGSPDKSSDKVCLTTPGTGSPALSATDPASQSCALDLMESRYDRSARNTVVAAQELDHWVHAQWGYGLQEVFGGRFELIDWKIHDNGFPAMKNVRSPAAPASTAIEDHSQYAVVYLGALIGIVLPACYGLVGALAGQVRSNYQRIKDNKLMPRHIRLIALPALLGCVSGVAVGLLFAANGGDGSSPTVAPQHLSGVDQLHLSTSAYCFLAGFGSENVFDALDALIRRIFNFNGSPPPTS